MTFTPQPTADGSATFFSSEFDEAFHSHFGAYQEAEGKFAVPCQLRQQAQQAQQLTLLDICYGLGYNSAAALAAIWAVNPHCAVTLVALDISDRPAQAAIAHNLLDPWPQPLPKLLAQLAQVHSVQTPKLSAHLYCGDARQTLANLDVTSFQANAIFLDPFSPPKCPQLWTVEFLAQVAQRLNPMGYLATYSCAAAVRTALYSAGLQIGSTAAIGRKAPGTLARWRTQALQPLSPQEQEHLQTRAAIPYRDPQLCATAAEILTRRHQEQARCNLESTGQWKRRWLGSSEF
ncbi:MAG: MnmC family methyltransferase [Cyanobacteria bacterium P01_G01_bin.54]